MIFGCQSSIIHKNVDIHIDIQARISLQVHSTMDIRKQQISINGYPCFMDISLQLSMLLRISMDFSGYPCIDLLWILDRGRLGWLIALCSALYGLRLVVERKTCEM